jgi:predicted methyltransferase
MKLKKIKLTKQLQTDFWEDTIDIRNCVFGRDCKQVWERLTDTTNASLKYCRKCERNVYMIENDNDVANAIRLNQCIAIKVQSQLKLI